MITLWNRFSVLSIKCIQRLSNLVLPRILLTPPSPHLSLSPSISPSCPSHSFPTHFFPPSEHFIILLTKCKLRIASLSGETFKVVLCAGLWDTPCKSFLLACAFLPFLLLWLFSDSGKIVNVFPFSLESSVRIEYPW